MNIIKNDIVKMEWVAEHFFESKSQGFIAAVREYDTPEGKVTVVFQDKVIFLLIDNDTEKPATVEDIRDALKVCFTDNLLVEEAFEDSYIELGIGGVDEEDTAHAYGLSDEDILDINKRYIDLSPYWEIIEETVN